MKSKADIEDGWRFELGEMSPELAQLTVRRLRLLQIAGALHGKAGYYPDGDFASDADWVNGPGAEIRELEDLLEDDSGEVHDLYADAHSALFRDGSINPSDREETLFAFQFGAYGDHEVRVHARSFEKGAELAAQYAHEKWPGLFYSDEDRAEHFADALRECGWPFLPELFDWAADDEFFLRVCEKAEEDVTSWDPNIHIASHEWHGHEVG